MREHIQVIFPHGEFRQRQASMQRFENVVSGELFFDFSAVQVPVKVMCYETFEHELHSLLPKYEVDAISYLLLSGELRINPRIISHLGVLFDAGYIGNRFFIVEIVYNPCEERWRNIPYIIAEQLDEYYWIVIWYARNPHH